eukprot:scaffold40680_cov60-Phaeocystis_antarctica.AAC.7
MPCASHLLELSLVVEQIELGLPGVVCFVKALPAHQKLPSPPSNSPAHGLDGSHVEFFGIARRGLGLGAAAPPPASASCRGGRGRSLPPAPAPSPAAAHRGFGRCI